MDKASIALPHFVNSHLISVAGSSVEQTRPSLPASPIQHRQYDFLTQCLLQSRELILPSAFMKARQNSQGINIPGGTFSKKEKRLSSYKCLCPSFSRFTILGRILWVFRRYLWIMSLSHSSDLSKFSSYGHFFLLWLTLEAVFSASRVHLPNIPLCHWQPCNQVLSQALFWAELIRKYNLIEMYWISLTHEAYYIHQLCYNIRWILWYFLCFLNFVEEENVT